MKNEACLIYHDIKNMFIEDIIFQNNEIIGINSDDFIKLEDKNYKVWWNSKIEKANYLKRLFYKYISKNYNLENKDIKNVILNFVKKEKDLKILKLYEKCLKLKWKIRLKIYNIFVKGLKY